MTDLALTAGRAMLLLIASDSGNDVPAYRQAVARGEYDKFINHPDAETTAAWLTSLRRGDGIDRDGWLLLLDCASVRLSGASRGDVWRRIGIAPKEGRALLSGRSGRFNRWPTVAALLSAITENPAWIKKDESA